MWRLVPGDASRLSTWQAVGSQLPRQHSLSGQHTFVLMMEVLDNLPHDRWVCVLGGVLMVAAQRGGSKCGTQCGCKTTTAPPCSCAVPYCCPEWLR